MPEEPLPLNLPVTLPDAERVAAEAASGVGAEQAEKEKEQFDRELSLHALQAAALKNRHVEAFIANMEADREMRKLYAGRILGYLEKYSLGVGVLLLLSGFGAKVSFTLDKEVVVALVGSTAVAAIGLVGFIARGLFRIPEPPKADGPTS